MRSECVLRQNRWAWWTTLNRGGRQGLGDCIVREEEVTGMDSLSDVVRVEVEALCGEVSRPAAVSRLRARSWVIVWGGGTIQVQRKRYRSLWSAGALLSKWEIVSQTALAVGLRFESLTQHISASFHTASESSGVSSSSGRSGRTSRWPTNSMKSTELI
jgi:hypothetical protein